MILNERRLVLLKTHVTGYTRKNGTYVPPHYDSRNRHEDEFEDDMTLQAAWLNERAREAGFNGVEDLLMKDPAQFMRLAERWRDEHPAMAKAIAFFESMLAKARADGWKKPTPAQAAAGNYFKPRIQWNGLEIAIENPKGTVREGVDETGAKWRTEFAYAYGEIAGTEGVDGDPVDVYMGPDESAPEVYIVRQMKRKNWDKYDEDKCFLGFPSMEAAKKAYLDHYDDPRFFGGIIAMPVAEFIEKVRATRDKPAMIKAMRVLFYKAAAS